MKRTQELCAIRPARTCSNLLEKFTPKAKSVTNASTNPKKHKTQQYQPKGASIIKNQPKQSSTSNITNLLVMIQKTWHFFLTFDNWHMPSLSAGRPRDPFMKACELTGKHSIRVPEQILLDCAINESVSDYLTT